jgi:TDG/mug DNA glycosylase family protein
MSRTPVPEESLPHEGLRSLYGTTPRVLILGSFPSVLSLAHGEYYGNPKNRFWAVMEELFTIPATLPYPERTLRLTQEKVALWDVVRGCRREGSADSRIRNPVPNDIAGFVRAHPSVRLVALNGSTAGQLYHRFTDIPGILSITLPSTSPANAAMPFEDKVRVWDVVRTACSHDKKKQSVKKQVTFSQQCNPPKSGDRGVVAIGCPIPRSFHKNIQYYEQAHPFGGRSAASSGPRWARMLYENVIFVRGSRGCNP